MRMYRSLFVAAALIAVAVSAAIAQNNTVFFTNKGDLNLPLTRNADPTLPMNFGSAPGITCPTYYYTGTLAFTDQVFFIATRQLLLMQASVVFTVAAGGTSTVQITKDTGTQAPGAGTDLLSPGFNLNATANTSQAGTLVTSLATRTFAAGDRLAVDYADAIQSSAGVVITACFAPI